MSLKSIGTWSRATKGGKVEEADYWKPFRRSTRLAASSPGIGQLVQLLRVHPSNANSFTLCVKTRWDRISLPLTLVASGWILHREHLVQARKHS